MCSDDSKMVKVPLLAAPKRELGGEKGTTVKDYLIYRKRIMGIQGPTLP